jgi:anti-anti-sigma factor
MMEDILKVTAEDVPGLVTVLTAAGEIDHDSRDVLADAGEEALRRRGVRLVIDLSAVTFCDSGGLSLFIDLHRRVTARGGSLCLASPQPPVLTVLRATNLDRLLALHPTVEDAVRASSATG